MILTEQQHEALIFGRELDGFEVVDNGDWICRGNMTAKKSYSKKMVSFGL